LEEKKDKIEILAKIVLLIQSDIACKVGDFQIEAEGNTQRLIFDTTNSLFYNGAFPVKVTYFLKKEGEKILFCREEISEETGIDFALPLTDIFKKVEYKFFSHGHWTDVPSEVVKVLFYTKDATYSFVQRGMLEQ